MRSAHSSIRGWDMGRRDSFYDRGFRDLTVFMFGYFSGLLSIAWMATG